MPALRRLLICLFVLCTVLLATAAPMDSSQGNLYRRPPTISIRMLTESDVHDAAFLYHMGKALQKKFEQGQAENLNGADMATFKEYDDRLVDFVDLRTRGEYPRAKLEAVRGRETQAEAAVDAGRYFDLVDRFIKGPTDSGPAAHFNPFPWPPGPSLPGWPYPPSQDFPLRYPQLLRPPQPPRYPP